MAKTQINKITNRIANRKTVLILGREWKNACPEVREIVGAVIDGGREAFTVGDYLRLVGDKF